MLNKLDDSDISISVNGNRNLIFDMNNNSLNYFKVELPYRINGVDKSFKIRNTGYIETGNLDVNGNIEINADTNTDYLIKANNHSNDCIFNVDNQGNLYLNGNIILNNNNVLTNTSLSYLTDISHNIQEQMNDSTNAANSANTNATNALNIVNQIENNVLNSINISTQAATDASNALTSANQLITEITEIKDTANQAATLAVTGINSATENATNALNNARNALTTSNQASIDANNALSNANQSIIDATNALTTANQASVTATNALTIANEASTNIETTTNTATQASNIANNALSIANQTATNANQFATTATIAINNANEITTDAINTITRISTDKLSAGTIEHNTLNTPTCTRIECGPSTHEYTSLDNNLGSGSTDSYVKERLFMIGNSSRATNNANGIFGLGFVGDAGNNNKVGVFMRNSQKDRNVDSNEYSFRLQGCFQSYENGNQSTINFTGQHPCIINSNITNDSIGLIVSTNGKYLNENNEITPTINESLPICEITNIENDKKIFGVISKQEDEGITRECGSGTYVSIIQKANNNERRTYINSVGEGGMWVCNKNGPLENGDYISSSSIPGYGMKQTKNEDCLTNYTVAKITCDCDFNLTKTIKQKLATDIITDLSGNKNNIIQYDNSGNIQYEEDLDISGVQQSIYNYDTRFLEESGAIIETETEYNSKLSNGENVFIACFIGCTYHCG